MKGIAAFAFFGANAFAETLATPTNAPAVSSSIPDMTSSTIRVFGALIFVVALFLGGVWLFRNWQRIAVRKGVAPKLNILEVKSLGQRQAIYVVGYQQQRMLIGSSPAGITLLSHLPAPDENETAEVPTTTKMSFGDALQQVLNRKS
jgi:flagellar biogenesis protein FliO